jgi:hypothetical protein
VATVTVAIIQRCHVTSANEHLRQLDGYHHRYPSTTYIGLSLHKPPPLSTKASKKKKSSPCSPNNQPQFMMAVRGDRCRKVVLADAYD